MDIVSLLRLLVNGLIEAEAKFFSNPKDLYALERQPRQRRMRLPRSLCQLS